jgi:hypothetical protein
MHVTINTPSLHDVEVPISTHCANTARLTYNPSNSPDVHRLKALAAAFLTECDRILCTSKSQSAREFATAKTNAQTALMWAVAGATAGEASD